MAGLAVTILGGGNTAFAAAANLTLAGATVTLCELPAFGPMVEPIRTTRQITLDGVARRGSARLHRVTTDFAEALAENELVLLIVPAYAERWKALIPTARVQTIDGAGHMLPYEQPEAFARTVGAFLG